MNIITIRRHLVRATQTGEIARITSVAAIVAGIWLGGREAGAQVINFDVPGGVGAVNYSGAGAAPDSGINWNPIAYKGTSSGGILSDGVTSSPITLTDNSPNNYNPGQGTQGTPGGLEAPYAYENNGTPVTDTLNNVPAGTYNLYLYGKNYPYADRGTTFTASVGATSYGTLSTVCSSTSIFTSGNDYVVFSNIVVTAGGAITFTYAANTGVSGNGEGDFNGVQLVNQATGNASGPSPGPSVTDIWTGTASGSWDVGITANWITNGVAGVYSQGNVVQFTDSSAVNTVNLTAALTPSSVLVNNNSANYTFAGNGVLGGTGAFSLTKIGSGMLTLSNANTFSGNIYVGGGILQVGNPAALGNATGSTIVSNGATLDLNGVNIGNEPVVIQGSGSSGQGAINNTGGAVYPAISQVTLAGDATLGNSGGTWEIKPQSSGGAASLSTGGNAYNLTKVGAGFVGLYGVTIDSKLHNIDVQAGSFDLENTTSGSLGDSTGSLTLESGTTLYFYDMLNPVSKPTVFNGAALSNNNGPTTFAGPVNLNGYTVFGLYSPLTISGPLSGTGPLEVQAGSGGLTLNGTNTYSGDIYLDSGVGPLAINGQSSASAGALYLANQDSVTINGAFGGSVTDSGATGTSLLGSGVITGSVDFSGLIYPGQINAPGKLTVGSLTLESSAVLNLDLSSSVAGSNDLLQVNGNLTLNGNAVVLNFLQGHLQVGTYRLINYTGTLSGSFGTVSTRAQATIDTSTPGQVNLIVTGGGTAANLIWNINNTGAWDIDISSNWLNSGTSTADLFYSGDNVSFTDLSGVPTSVAINGGVAPGSITVNSSVNNFTFNGPGTITGSGSLTKLGTSTLTLTTAGGMTGPVLIAGGTVATPGNTLADASSVTVTNGGTFDIAGSSLSATGPIIASGSGANGQGAIFNSVGSYPGEDVNIILAGDTVFGGSARWDLNSGTQINGSHALTIDWSAGAGYGEWNTITVGTNVSGITLVGGSIGMKFMDAGFQNPATVFTVTTNCQMVFYNGGYNGSLHVQNGAQVNIYTAPAAFNGSTITLETGSQWLSYYNSADQPVNSAIVLNGISHFIIGDHNMIYTNVVSGPGGFVADYYNHAVVFSASNTYAGPTIIGSSGNSPDVALTGIGSISHSSFIFFGGNDSTVVRVDASGRNDQTFTLANGQTLAGIGGVMGNLVVAAGATISPAGTNTTIGITAGANTVGTLAASGTVSLAGTTVVKLNGAGTNDEIQAGGNISYGGALNLVNVGSAPLAAGNSFQVFQAANYLGSFNSIVPTTPGAGLTWDLSRLNNGIVAVAGGARPILSSPRLTAGGIVLSGSGGPANGTYYVLTSTNLTLPLASWTPIATNNFDGAGNFNLTNAINAGRSSAFYAIKQP